MQQKFRENWKEHFGQLSPDSFRSNCQLIVAVSGGADSVVLTDLIFNEGFDFAIAHCNFQLRGEESERDEAFVISLAEKYGKPVFVKKFETSEYVAVNKISIQEAARELRYAWFKELVMNNEQWEKNNEKPRSIGSSGLATFNIQHPTSNSYILTAHHANDNIETVLLNFFRGTGISGLHGILPKQDNILRPLLFATKEDILEYAKKKKLSWVEDSSNESDKYSRNYFRNKIIPLLKTIYPRVEQNLLQNIERFKETEIVYTQAIDLYKKKLLIPKGNEFHIPILLLKKSKPLPTILYEIIKEFGFSSQQVNEIKKLPDADNGSYTASGTHRIIKNRKWLIIALLQSEMAAHILIEEKDRIIPFPQGKLSFKTLPSENCKPSNINSIATLNATEIKFPLLLRQYKQGDYFYPLGMRKKKKLSRFFIDQKLSATAKENVWVLEMDKKIIWVVGYRIDDRFKITASTTNILEVSLEIV